jgi:hypothetical protein
MAIKPKKRHLRAVSQGGLLNDIDFVDILGFFSLFAPAFAWRDAMW